MPYNLLSRLSFVAAHIRDRFRRLILAAGLLALPLSAAAEAIPVVEVAAPAINCFAHPDCRITVSDSINVLGKGSQSEFGFLQSRSSTSTDNSPAAGQKMMQYRLTLVGAESRRGKPCVKRIDLRGVPLRTALDLDGDGKKELAVFAVTRGALGT